ncbi:MAG TPA: DtxR family transcriptional regulator [Candidatus Hydrogenedentes bacterium]|nr:DtxR family transcriptional regulator [Candidatus Hydrogenedentota bacterium]HPG66243.1 DtxR family transcriptional regulator [Candidatus Hydrogenedentota bacterium]
MADIALSASLEDYLEAIYTIVSEKQAARAKDIADKLKVHRSSVTNALHELSDRLLINYAPYDIVTLTDKGRAVGADIVRRHEILSEFFVKVLAVDEALADRTACEMEHVVPRPVLDRFIRFVEYVETCPRGGAKWIKGFAHYCTEGASLDDCEHCVEACLVDVRKRKNQGETNSMAVALTTLNPGQRARVTKVKGRGPVSQRIRAMGITPGAVMEIERVAPLGDPVDIKVRGYHLSLRREDLDGIEVECLAGPVGKPVEL